MSDIYTRLPVLGYGNDGSNDIVLKVNSSGQLEVDVIATVLKQYNDGDVNTSAYGNLILGDDGTNLQSILVDNNGRLQIDAVLQAGSANIGKVIITDGTDDAAVDSNNNLQVNLNAIGVTAVPISKDSNSNSLTNPIYVKTVETDSSTEINDYDVATAIVKDATSNHDLSVTAGKTLLVKQVMFSASGAMKIEIQVGPSAALVTKAVGFTSMATPTYTYTFDAPIEITENGGGEMIRVIKTNRDNQAQDLYTTIIGNEV